MSIASQGYIQQIIDTCIAKQLFDLLLSHQIHLQRIAFEQLQQMIDDNIQIICIFPKSFADLKTLHSISVADMLLLFLNAALAHRETMYMFLKFINKNFSKFSNIYLLTSFISNYQCNIPIIPFEYPYLQRINICNELSYCNKLYVQIIKQIKGDSKNLKYQLITYEDLYLLCQFASKYKDGTKEILPTDIFVQYLYLLNENKLAQTAIAKLPQAVKQFQDSTVGKDLNDAFLSGASIVGRCNGRQVTERRGSSKLFQFEVPDDILSLFQNYIQNAEFESYHGSGKFATSQSQLTVADISQGPYQGLFSSVLELRDPNSSQELVKIIIQILERTLFLPFKAIQPAWNDGVCTDTYCKLLIHYCYLSIICAYVFSRYPEIDNDIVTFFQLDGLRLKDQLQRIRLAESSIDFDQLKELTFGLYSGTDLLTLLQIACQISEENVGIVQLLCSSQLFDSNNVNDQISDINDVFFVDLLEVGFRRIQDTVVILQELDYQQQLMLFALRPFLCEIVAQVKFSQNITQQSLLNKFREVGSKFNLGDVFWTNFDKMHLT